MLWHIDTIRYYGMGATSIQASSFEHLTNQNARIEHVMNCSIRCLVHVNILAFVDEKKLIGVSFYSRRAVRRQSLS